MIQPPSPPEKATEYLEELGEYYRELMEYHQKAAMIAAEQLVHVEALLGKDTGSPLDRMKFWLLGDPPSNNNYLESELDTEDKDYYLEDSGEVALESTEGDEGVESVLNGEPPLTQDNSNYDNSLKIKNTLPTLKELKDFFEKDRGKMLQIDYIIQHFYGQVNQFEKQEIKPLLLEKLKTGSLKHLWSQVPDAPDCWTFTLLDFPEFSNNKGDNPLFPDLKSDVLPTKKVAENLGTIPAKIYELRNIYSDKFSEGSDYFRNSKGHYFWTENGVNKLSQFKQELESDKKQKKQQRLSPSPSSAPQMLPRYRGFSMQKAIKKLFKSNPGREWTVSEIREEMYGKLPKTQESEARKKITKSLSHGHLMGLWRRVSNKVGVYRSN
jgi:hypothetical protein